MTFQLIPRRSSAGIQLHQCLGRGCYRDLVYVWMKFSRIPNLNLHGKGMVKTAGILWGAQFVQSQLIWVAAESCTLQRNLAGH